MRDVSRETLEAFVAKAQKLIDSRFSAFIQEGIEFGCVAKILEDRKRHPFPRLLSLNYHSEQVGDERYLTANISLAYSSHLSFAYHVHHLVSAARVRSAVSMEKKPNPGLTSRLMRAVILFDEIIQIFDYSKRPKD